MILIFLFLFGLVIGSFLNVLADRLSRGESVVWKRSHCDHCRHTLAWNDLIPVLSYVMLHGRCRYCKRRFSWQYPAAEITTGLVFVILYCFIPFTAHPTVGAFVYILIVLCCLFVIVLADLRYRIIPDEMIIVLLVLSFFHRIILPLFSLSFSTVSPANALLSSLILGGIFLGLVLITRGKGMGWGDVKYAFWMGLFLGYPGVVVGFYLSFLTGAAVSLILIGWKRKTLKSAIPFWPFLVGATVISYFFGDVIWEWLMTVMYISV